MRFAAPAAALALALALSASMGHAGPRKPDARAGALAEQGRLSLAAGDTQGAIDAFEAALAVDPAYTALFIDLAEAARQEGLQGKAIHYYREARQREPDNLAAITGEGEALVEKGALSAARENLAELEDRCGSNCAETRKLAAAIAAGRPLITADATAPEGGVSQN